MYIHPLHQMVRVGAAHSYFFPDQNNVTCHFLNNLWPTDMIGMLLSRQYSAGVACYVLGNTKPMSREDAEPVAPDSFRRFAVVRKEKKVLTVVPAPYRADAMLMLKLQELLTLDDQANDRKNVL